MTFAVDGASTLWVRRGSTRQVVDVSTIEDNVFAMIGTWLVLMTPIGEPHHVLQCKLGHALEAVGPIHVDSKGAVDRQRPCAMGRGNGRSCKSMCKTVPL